MQSNSLMVGKHILIRALTSLHPGCGSSLGAIDLPVQRERHTSWPLIPSTSLKGVFRDAARQNGDKDIETRLFGGEGENGLNAGALTFTDARILAFPVRSLIGTYALVTCPMALDRYERDLGLFGHKPKLPRLVVPEGQGAVHKESILLHKESLFLEEFQFSPLKHDLSSLEFLPSEERKRLVVVHDDQFTWFVEFATETVARIGLDHETKTVARGALFYQELLPPETLLYALVGATGNKQYSAADNLQAFVHPSYLQFGGDETTGKGLCHVESR